MEVPLPSLTVIRKIILTSFSKYLVGLENSMKLNSDDIAKILRVVLQFSKNLLSLDTK